MKAGKKPVSGFELIEHLSDIGIRFYGKTPEELFSKAAKAMFGIMGSSSATKAEESYRIVIGKGAQSYDDLLILWLEKLLYFLEVKGTVLSRFKVEKIEKNEENFSLTARVWGEDYNPARHRIEVVIKAPTYHRLEVREDKGSWRGTVIFDI